MRKLFFLLLCGMLCPFLAQAQTIKGFVYDAQTNEPLAGVSISYGQKEPRGTFSDEKGAYSLDVPEGGVDLVVSYLGYEDVKLPIVINKREVLTRDIYMKVATNLLQDVVITAGRFEQKVSDVTVSMNVLKQQDITKQAPTDLSETLRQVPGVDVNDKQPSIRGGSGWTYSVGSRCLMLVDGMNALTVGSNELNWNNVPVNNISQVEIIKGASSVLYGSSALNGIINVRTARPGVDPKTHFSTYVGIYGNPKNKSYDWNGKSMWQDGDYQVEPLLRNSLYSGVRNPIYEGWDLSHSRRIGNFDVSGALNLFTDEGYRQQGYNKRMRLSGSLTYHQPDMGEKYMNYGFNTNYMTNEYGDFFIWRSAAEPYKASPLANMGREENTFEVAPFFNYSDPNRGFTHKVRARVAYRGDNIIKPTAQPGLTEIIGNMDPDVDAISSLITNVQNGNLTDLLPVIQPILEGYTNGDLMGGVTNAIGPLTELLGNLFPGADTNDCNDLIAWVLAHGLPITTEGGTIGLDTKNLVSWLTDAINVKTEDVGVNDVVDKTYNYYVDYQFGKKFNNGIQLTAGVTYDHITYNSLTAGNHQSDNAALYIQYDQRFFDRLSISAGMRGEYYRIDDSYREAETKIFGIEAPFRPVFRAGINYQLAEYSFLRASFGQGYRNPTIIEKYALKDIGGFGVFPNPELKAEKGFNAELGFKQGYKIGGFQGVFDVAGFYTEYDDMIEYYFGLLTLDENGIYHPSDGINSIVDAVNHYGGLSTSEHTYNGSPMSVVGIGAQFRNVSKAQIYGVELETTGQYSFDKNTALHYSLGYTYIEPRDADYKERNERESQYTDPLQMKEKSNDSKYLKYRQKHTFKASLDFAWKRISIGANLTWKSKILAVDYLMVDERAKDGKDLMDYVREIMFGNIEGQTLASYWAGHNTDYCTVDFRFGVRVTEEVSFRFLINNLTNTEYSYRPMALAAPRTYVVQLNVDI